MFGHQPGVVSEPYNPMQDTIHEETFEITVSKVDITKHPESKTVWKHKETGKIENYVYENEEQYDKIVSYTGKMEHDEKSEVIYKQRKSNLDLAELAINLNRR